MKKNNFFHSSPLLIALLCIFFPFASLSCSASRSAVRGEAPQDVKPTKGSSEQKDVLAALLPAYKPWQKAEMNGKLRIPGVPVTPSVKIYMQNGERLQISIRAFLLGEVGKIEVAGDSVLAVNKMKGTYVKESLQKIRDEYPSILADAQSVLLGRVVVLKEGELCNANADRFGYKKIEEIDLTNPNGRRWKLTYPRENGDMADYSYSYTVNDRGDSESLRVDVGSKDVVITLDSKFRGNGRDIEINYKKGTKTMSGEFILEAVNWNPSVQPPVSIPAGYTRVTLSQFIKNIV